jgi:alkylation response protein AidB-like acyl-CoA dehydrogenase
VTIGLGQTPALAELRTDPAGRTGGVAARHGEGDSPADRKIEAGARPRKLPGLDVDTLNMILEALQEFAARRFPDHRLLELDGNDEAPLVDLRAMCSQELGIHLLFLPEEYGGMGGGSFDVYRISERLGAIDLGIATGVCVGSMPGDVIFRGGTARQRQEWLPRIAEKGLLMAYAATEPEAGSDLGALQTTATPMFEDGSVVGYRITGKKQWISNGGIADAYAVLAMAPGGPTWFLVDAGTPGFEHGKPEDKQGLRTSNTAALFLQDVHVDADRRVGAVEGQGLLVAQTVFGYSRLMVAALALGAGWAALDRAIAYAMTRMQGGGPLSQKQGYTHKLVVPHVVRLEAARSYIEESAERIDAGEGSLNTEGAIAKYMATEAGHGAADASIQALGGYGYTREYMVEKITRDVRVTRIFEGTSEIMETTIARDRWQQHLKTQGRHFQDEAKRMEALQIAHDDVGAGIAAYAFHGLAEVMEQARRLRLTRQQHVLLRLGELIANVECAGSLSRRAARAADGELHPKADVRFTPEVLAVMARIFAREAAFKVIGDGLRWVLGAGPLDFDGGVELETALRLPLVHAAQRGLVADMDQLAGALYGRSTER